MKRALDIIRFTIISPEFLLVLACIVVLYSYPLPLSMIGDKIGLIDDVWKWLPTLPLLFAGLVFKLSFKVRAPFDKGNKQLYEWFQYNRITDRLYASYILVCISVMAVISVWLFTEKFSSAVIGCIFFFLGRGVRLCGITSFFSGTKNKRDPRTIWRLNVVKAKLSYNEVQKVNYIMLLCNV